MLWYPGRIPLCAPLVVQGLEHYIATLSMAALRQDPTHVETAQRIYKDVHAILYDEGLDCLGSDTDINALLTLLAQTQQAAELCVQNDCWDDLHDVIDAIDQVRWSLAMKHEQGGTDDGQDCTAPTPTTNQGPGMWTSSAQGSGEEDGPEYEGDPSEAEGALPGCDEEGLG